MLRTHTIHITERDKNELDIQNNCSMCPPFTWTTAFSLSRNWSIDLLIGCWSRLSQQVRLLASENVELQITLRDTSHRAARYAGKFLDFTMTFASAGIVFLTAFQLGNAWDSGAFGQTVAVHCQLFVQLNHFCRFFIKDSWPNWRPLSFDEIQNKFP